MAFRHDRTIAAEPLLQFIIVLLITGLLFDSDGFFCWLLWQAAIIRRFPAWPVNFCGCVNANSG